MFEKLTEEQKAQLHEDFKLSDADEVRLTAAIHNLHKLCKELDVPMLTFVVSSKVKILEESEADGEETFSISAHHAQHLNGGRVPPSVSLAALILEKQVTSPEELLKCLLTMD